MCASLFLEDLPATPGLSFRQQAVQAGQGQRREGDGAQLSWCRGSSQAVQRPGCSNTSALCFTEGLSCCQGWRGHYREEQGWELRQKKGGVGGLQDPMSCTSRGFAHTVLYWMATLKGGKLEGPVWDTLGQHQLTMGRELPV